MKISGYTGMLALIAMLASGWGQASELFTADGYRATHYRSPTPLSHDFAVTLTPEQLQQLLQEQPAAALIDAYNNPWLHGHFSMQKEHHNLPGTYWLANCGQGQLDADWQAYCQHWLQDISKGDKNAPLVMYCRADCWLGWNAARRAHEWGYTQLYWLRDGIEGWVEAGQTLERSQPLPWPEGLAAPGE